MKSSAVRVFAVGFALLLHAHVLCAQGLPTARPEEVGMSSERLARLTAVMRGYVDDDGLAGAVVLIARQGRVPYFEAFGRLDREGGAAMERDALFRIASQSKALVSVAILMLQEEGRLLIADPVRKHLPEFARTTVAVRRAQGEGYDVVAASRPITLRDLLTHTAGIGYGSGVARDRWGAAGITGWYFAHRDEPIGETVARMAALPFDAQPGERFVYGYSTDILGVVVERVSGMPLDAFLRTRIFEPLGMHDTAFYVGAEDADRLATVYSATPSGLERAPSPGGMIGQGAYVDGPRRSFSGGAGLVSTAPDYARFLQMLLNGGELDGVRILAPSTVALMTADHIGDVYPTAGAGFGLGFEITTDAGRLGRPGTTGTFGWGGAYHSTYWVDPTEALVVVYMTQLIPAGTVDDHGRVRALVYQAIVEPPKDDRPGR
jgi:CubicO group peptidase (beta-lactamase class C family)